MDVRTMMEGDAEAVANLSEQLGYPMSTPVIRERIKVVNAHPEHSALVAEANGKILGWIHVYVAQLIESPNSYVEIGGLVVDAKARGSGVGKALVRAGEHWAVERRIDDIRVRSNTKRTEAHAFYQHLGYKVQKTQVRLVKRLALLNPE
jgi:GNAT superfamily N-acetyltransferase